MSDNIPFPIASGTVAATDEVGGAHFQQIKLVSGELGSTTPVLVDTGAKANALRVVPANDIPTGTYLGDVRISGVQPVSGFISVVTPIGITGTVSIIPASVIGVTGTFFQAKQPVSIPDAIGVSGTFWQSTQPVSVASPIGVSGTVSVNPNSVFGVTGTFFQAVQPVSLTSPTSISGTVSVIPNSAFGVTGTFWQSKQPVSVPDAISISGSFGVTPNSVFGVTGTFFQAKQPVSVPDAISISGSFGVTPNSVFGVTGTFFQATQPVSVASAIGISGTVSVNTHAVTPAAVFGVTGTFFQATQPVSVASSIGITGTVTVNTHAVTPAAAFGVTGTVTVIPGAIFGVTGTFSATPAGAIVIAQTPTITAGSYSALDAVGGKLTFANAASGNNGKGIINSVIIVDDDKELAGLELWLYSQDFTNTADNAAFDPTDADNENLIGVVPISAADYYSANDNGVAVVRGVGLEFQCTNNQSSIYGQLKCTGTPTYTATTDLTVKVAIEYLT